MESLNLNAPVTGSSGCPYKC